MIGNSSSSYRFEYVILFMLSLAINSIFLYVTYQRGEYCFGTLLEHGEVGYNVARYNSCKINPLRTEHIAKSQEKLGRYVDYAEVDHSTFGRPTTYRDSGDTIGYGLLLGLLWKVTSSYRYLDMQILQIIIFSLLMPLVFQCARMLFGNRLCAFICSLMVLCFFPLIFQNVQAHRDIWAYYGLVVLLYSLLSFLAGRFDYWKLFFCSLIVACIQYIRPNLFFGLLTVSMMLFLYALMDRPLLKRVGLALILLFGANVIGFWVPYCVYNHHAYGTLFAGPIGQDLLEGIGEYPNPWGYQLDDGWYHRYMKEQYPHLKTREERDAQAKALFVAAVKERPGFFAVSFFKRALGLVLPNLPWSYYPEWLYEGCYSFRDKIKAAFVSAPLCLDLIGRMLYVRIFLMLGYLGLALLLARKASFQAMILGGIVIGGYGKFLSHIEYRYIVPFYWPFAFFLGYLLWFLLFKGKALDSAKGLE
jgi:hypothetical protein